MGFGVPLRHVGRLHRSSVGAGANASCRQSPRRTNPALDRGLFAARETGIPPCAGTLPAQIYRIHWASKIR